MHGDFSRILGQFISRFGKEDGTARFNQWVKKRSLDTGKAYGPDQVKKKECLHCKKSGSCSGKCQVKESFKWAKPLISLLKNDETGKTYKVEANFVIRSMNNVLYTRDENAQAISTLPSKRVDLDHNVDKPIKGAEMLAAAFEDDCAEVLLHVKNGAKDEKGRDVQETIDSGIIDCVSIEADADDADVTDDGVTPRHMHYDGLALLDQDALPGIPLTRIMSLESVMESIFKEMLTLEKPSHMEVNESMTNTKKIEEMSVDDLKKQIVDLSQQLSAIDKKMWPQSEPAKPVEQPTDKERAELRAQQVILQTELSATQNALVAALEDELNKDDGDNEERLQETVGGHEVAKAGFYRLNESVFFRLTKEDVAYVTKSFKEGYGDAATPDKCFLWVPDSARGPNGRKGDRKLPVYKPDGTPDLPHVRNALARLNQTQGIPAADKARFRKILQDILAKANPDYEPSNAEDKDFPPHQSPAAKTTRVEGQCLVVEDKDFALHQAPGNQGSAATNLGNDPVARGTGGAPSDVDEAVSAKFCPMCGKALKAGVCENDLCPVHGAKIALSSDVVDAEEKLKVSEAKVTDLTGKLEEKLREVSLANAGNAEEDAKTAAVIAELNEKLAKATRENARNATLEIRLQKSEEERVKANGERDKVQVKASGYAANIAGLELKNSEQAQTLGVREQEITQLSKAVGEAKELAEKKEAEKENLRRDLEDERFHTRTAEAKANAKVEELSKLKVENAGLLEEKAARSKNFSETSEKYNEAVKAKLALEGEVSKLKEDLGKRDKIIADNQELNEKLKLKNKESWKLLNKFGQFEIDGKGNAVVA